VIGVKRKKGPRQIYESIKADVDRLTGFEVASLISYIDAPAENAREYKEDPWPHARPRQVEGLLDSGMFDFAFAGSSPVS